MSDILEELKNRKRASVPLREDPLVTGSRDPQSKEVPQRSSLNSDKTLELEADVLHEVADRRQIRLEASIDREMELLFSGLPRRERVTFETFLEAAYLACQRDESLMNTVLAEARTRLVDRKKAGSTRRVLAQRSNV